MRPVYIIEAVRSAIGRRGGGLSTLHPADLLGRVQKAALDRSGVPAERIGQIIGGCVSQVGEQMDQLVPLDGVVHGDSPVRRNSTQSSSRR